jgi:D-arabinose 1-dehydrogenase-like Zn-dependent alcohol dehydrogenase
MTFLSRTLKRAYLESSQEMAELMELVKAGKIEIDVEEVRHILRVNDNISVSKTGRIKELVCLEH